MCMGQRVKGGYPFLGNNCFLPPPHLSILVPSSPALRHLVNKLLSVTCLLQLPVGKELVSSCLSVLSLCPIFLGPSTSTFLSLRSPIFQTFCLSVFLSLCVLLFLYLPVSQSSYLSDLLSLCPLVSFLLSFWFFLYLPSCLSGHSCHSALWEQGQLRTNDQCLECSGDSHRSSLILPS